MRLKFTAIFAALAVAVSAWGAVPVTAKTLSREYKITPTGRAILLWKQVGTYMRSSDGSVSVQMHYVLGSGMAGPSVGMLREGQTGRVYKMFWASKHAYLVQQLPLPLKSPYSRATGPVRRINGVACVVKPVHGTECVNGHCTPLPPSQYFGWTCGSPKFGTFVHMETERRVGGVTYYTVMDTYDFHAGVEPPAEAMHVPRDFAITRRLLRKGVASPDH